MSTEENKNLQRQVFEALNRKDANGAGELSAPDCKFYGFASQALDLDGYIEFTNWSFSVFPDLQFTIEDMIAEGDKVITRGVFTGTHTGDFMGIPATGRKVSIKYLDIWRLENGKAKENWVQMDLLGLMQQLGVIPAPGLIG